MITIIKNSLIVLLAIGLSVSTVADMQPLDEAELQNAIGMQGISQSAKLEFAKGTRLSFANPDADYKNPLPNGEHYWLVVDNITGSVEFKNMKTEYIGDFGPSQNVGAVVTTLPETIEFDKFRTDGIYLGPGKELTRNASNEVTSNHRFIMGIEIDGRLELPAATTMTVFAIE